MAFSMFSDEQDQFGYLVETTFGSANADNAAFKQILFPKGTKIEPFVQLSDLGNDRSARQQVLSDLHVDNYSGPVQITVPEFPLTLDRVADILYGVLQNKTAETGDPFAKTFKVHLSQPDFTADAGFFFTLAWKGPVASKHHKVAGCIWKDITIKWDKSGKGDQNLVKVSGTIVGRAFTTGSNLTGTWVAQGTTRYNSHDFSFKYADTTAMEWLTATLKIDNGAEPLYKTAAGLPKTWALKWPHGGITFDIGSWYNANTTGTIVDVVADYIAGTARAYSILTSTTPTLTGGLKAVFYGILNKDPQDLASNKEMRLSLSWLCGHNNTTTNDLIIVTCTDGVDQTP